MPGRVPRLIDWYEAFGTWKLAVVLQQLYNRYAAGDTEDERRGRFGAHVPPIAGHAHDILGHDKRSVGRLGKVKVQSNGVQALTDRPVSAQHVGVIAVSSSPGH
jgi:hypothetical protein